MVAVKIVFITKEKQIVLYAQGIEHNWQVETHVLERLGEVERKALASATFRKYWIDDEQDRVEIMNDVDFDFFLKSSAGNKTPKIYFEATASPQPTPAATPRDEASLSIHPTVECDVCLQAPIRGFRYKCLQCPNFDLCMKCEADMKHPEHLMLRIPTSDSPKLETVCPIASVFGRSARRQQKHAARAAALANAAALAGGSAEVGGDGCSKSSRHHRHHRKACSGGAGLLANFYDMMQDLAEGGGVPKENNPETPQKAAEGPTSTPQPQPGSPVEQVITSVKVIADAAAKEAAAAAAAANVAALSATAAARSASKQTNTSPDRRASTTSTTSEAAAQTPPKQGVPVSPSLENLIDPNFMKAGIQILNNFSEMFGKILDPVVTEGGVSRASSSAPESVQVDLTAGGETGGQATPPPTAAETPNKPASTVASGFATPMETDNSNPATAPTEAAPERSRTQSEENDWTMIDTEASNAAQTAAAAAAAAATSSRSIDFIKLSQQLQSHIEREMQASNNSSVEMNLPSSSPAPSVTPPTQPTAPVVAAPVVSAPVVSAPTVAVPNAAATAPEQPAERRAVAVFHADPRINNAIHGMMAMGFSNEGAVLTQLLESVNGSIPLALDLMAAAQR